MSYGVRWKFCPETFFEGGNSLIVKYLIFEIDHNVKYFIFEIDHNCSYDTISVEWSLRATILCTINA